MMSRKDYVAVAAILEDSNTVSQVVYSLANLFQADNPNFDRDRFLTASGVGSGEPKKAAGV